MGRDLILRSRLKFANSRCKKKVSLYLLYNFNKQFERVAQIYTTDKFRVQKSSKILQMRIPKFGPQKSETENSQ